MTRQILGSKGGGGGSDFITKPDTLRSNDSFEILLGLGSGRWKGIVNGLKGLKINGVPLENSDGSSNFEDVHVLFADGNPLENQMVRFQLGGGGSTQTVNVQLSNPNSSGPGPWVSGATSTPNADFVDLRFVVQQLFYQDEKSIRENTATIEVEMRPSGSSSWINIFTAPASSTTEYDPEGYDFLTGGEQQAVSVRAYLPRRAFNSNGVGFKASNNPNLVVRGKTNSAFVKELRVAVPRTGSYENKTWEVRARLIEKDTVDTEDIQQRRMIIFESVGAVIKEPLGDHPDWDGQVWMQIIGKASDQFNGFPEIEGVFDTKICRTPPTSVWNPETRQYTGVTWDGSYEEHFTTDPAWQIKEFVEDPIHGLAGLQPGSTLDKWDALEASQYFSELVPDGRGGTHPRFSMNLTINEARDVNEMMQYLAGAVNSYTQDVGDGLWRLKVDKPETHKTLFTLDNVFGEFNYSHTDVDSRFNDWRGTFLNEEIDYEQDTVRVFDQDDIDENGTRFTEIALIGCTNRQEALRRLMFRLRVSLNEYKVVSFTTNKAARYLSPLDTILIADGSLNADPILKSTSRVASLNTARTTVFLRRPIRLETGVSYTLHFTTADKTTVSRTVTNAAGARGDVTQVTLNSALPDNILTDSAVALQAVGLPSNPLSYRIISVERSEDNEDEYSVVASLVDSGKWNAMDNVSEQEIQSQESSVTIDSPTAPAGGMFDVLVYATEFDLKRALQVNWDRPGSLFLAGFKVEYRINDGPWKILSENLKDSVIELENPQDGVYDFKITALDRRGVQSNPLIGRYELIGSRELTAPTHLRGPLASRPSTAPYEGFRYTVSDSNPPVTQVWEGGEWVAENNLVTEGSQIGVENGATVGMTDSEADVLLEIQTDITTAKDDITDLFNTYGDTASAAQSAADAAQALIDTVDIKDIADAHRAAAQLAEANAVAAKDAALAAEQGATDQAGFAEEDRIAAQTAHSGAESARDTALLARDTAQGHAATATTQASLAASTKSSLDQRLADTLPERLDALGTGFFATNTDSDYLEPALDPLINEYPASQLRRPDIDDLGDGQYAWRRGAGSAPVLGYNIGHTSLTPMLPGRIYSFTFEGEVTSGSASVTTLLIGLDEALTLAGADTETQTLPQGPFSMRTLFISREAGLPGVVHVPEGRLFRMFVRLNDDVTTLRGKVFRVRDVTEQFNSQQAATAAVSSASTASIKASEASQSADAATTAKVAAETAKGLAETYRNESVSARDTAQGHAATATTQAALSVSSSTSARLAALATYSTRTDTLDDWQNYTAGDVRDPLAGGPPHLGAQVVNDSDLGPAIEQTMLYITPRATMPCVAGRKYRIRCGIKITDSTSDDWVRVLVYTRLADNGPSGIAPASLIGSTAAPGEVSYLDAIIDCDEHLAANPNVEYIYLIFRTAYQRAGRLGQVFIEDVTESEKAEEAANAALVSSATATTKASEAANSASIATQQAGIATAKAGDATQQAGFAQQYKADAEAAADNSESSSLASAASALTAVSAAGTTTPSTFEGQGDHVVVTGSGHGATFVTGTPKGTIIRTIFGGNYLRLIGRNGLPLIAGHTYRFYTEIRSLANGSGDDGLHRGELYSGDMRRIATPADVTYVGALAASPSTLPANDVWQTIEWEYTAPASPTDSFVFPGMMIYIGNIRPNRQIEVAQLGIEDVTDKRASEAAASAAVTNAAVASTKRDEASGFAATASTQAGIAVSAKNDAETAAGVSTTQAAIATDKAAASQTIFENVASLRSNALNKNAGFDDYPSAAVGAIPTGWDDGAINVGAGYRVPGPNGGYSWRLPGGVGQSAYGRLNGEPGTVTNGEFLNLRAEITLNQGSLDGAGVLLYIRDSSGNTIQTHAINFWTDPNSTGESAQQFGASEQRMYRFEKTIKVSAPQADSFALFPMTHWTGFDSTLPYFTDITWHECSVSPPTAADASVGIITGAIVGPGGPAAFLEQVVAASGSTPAKYQMLAGQDGSRIGLVADVISLGNDVDGIEDVLVVENGKARISAALIRELQVPPTPTSEIFHDVMLKPRIYIGGDGDTIQYQGGASYGANPARIDPDLSGLPALAEGESYDVKAVSVTPTQFTARAKKISTPVDVTQQSNAGTNKGSSVDPQWQTNKPTTADAHDGYYEFTFSGTVPKTSQQGPDGGYYYRGSVTLKGRTSAGWQVLENVQITRYIAGGLGSYPPFMNFSQTEMVQSSANFGSGADRFGVQPSTGTSITIFDGVRYVTRTSASTTAITNDIRWTVYPPGNG